METLFRYLINVSSGLQKLIDTAIKVQGSEGHVLLYSSCGEGSQCEVFSYRYHSTGIFRAMTRTPVGTIYVPHEPHSNEKLDRIYQKIKQSEFLSDFKKKKESFIWEENPNGLGRNERHAQEVVILEYRNITASIVIHNPLDNTISIGFRHRGVLLNGCYTLFEDDDFDKIVNFVNFVIRLFSSFDDKDPNIFKKIHFEETYEFYRVDASEIAFSFNGVNKIAILYITLDKDNICKFGASYFKKNSQQDLTEIKKDVLVTFHLDEFIEMILLLIEENL
jgi:hypothetical protein